MFSLQKHFVTKSGYFIQHARKNLEHGKSAATFAPDFLNTNH